MEISSFILSDSFCKHTFQENHDLKAGSLKINLCSSLKMEIMKKSKLTSKPRGFVENTRTVFIKKFKK